VAGIFPEHYKLVRGQTGTPPFAGGGILPFSLKGDFKFLKTTFVEPYCPEKNSENFRILQSHNLLSARCLQKTIEASIYKNAEIRKIDGRNDFLWSLRLYVFALKKLPRGMPEKDL
jgi:hypothetical protein